MALTDEERTRLQRYRRKDDRADEPVFVGREALFRLIEDNAAAVADGDDKGRTVCVAGPPGIGKTAFLAKLHERSAAPEREGGNGILTLKVPAIAFSRKDELLVQMLEALPEAWRPPKGAIPGLLDRLQVDQFGLGGVVRVAGRTQAKPPAMDVGGFPWNEMPGLLGQIPPEVVVCLLIDEAHGLQPSAGLRNGVDRNYAVGGLHEGPPPHLPGPGRRVFGVFAGHTHTPEVLRKSISRRFAKRNRVYMENLSESDSLRYVEGTLDHLGVPRSDPGRKALAHWVVGECGGFPHHLRNAMDAVVQGLLAANSPSLSDLDGGVVEVKFIEAREDYYGDRTDGPLSLALPELGEPLRDWSRRARSVSEAQGRLELSALLRGLPDDVRQEMADEGVVNGGALLQEMIQRGALTPDRRKGCRCPIDSLAAWMERGGGRHVLHTGFPKLSGPKPRKDSEGPSL